jgi:hypothetical protein
MYAQPVGKTAMSNPGQGNDWYLKKHAGEGIDEAVAWHTVGIISDQGRSIGTGSAILWGGAHLLLTAYHVIKDNKPQDLWCLFRPDGTLRRTDSPEDVVVTDTELRARQKAEFEDLEFDEDLDLAALKVPDLSSQFTVHFHELDPGSKTPPIDTTVSLMGFPSDLARRVTEDAWGVFRSVEVTQIGPPVELERFDPSRCFLINYPSADRMHPRGFSGAGVWYHQGPTEVWHPNLGLAGVCTNYYTAKELLEIVRVESVIKFLQNYWT